MKTRKYLLMPLLVTMFLFTLFAPLTSAQAMGNDSLAGQLVEQMNQVRAAKNLPSFQQDDTLTAVAREQGQKIAAGQSYNYNSLYQLQNSGKYPAVQMQVMRASDIVALAKSQLNNANTPALHSQYNVVGVAVVDNGYFGQVAVQIFAQAKDTKPSVNQPTKPERPDVKPEQPDAELPQQQPAPTPQPKPVPDGNQPGATTPANFQAEVVQLVNQERAKAGLAPLAAKQDLANVAQTKAQDMATKNYFSHTSPTYGSPFDMMRQFGINYQRAGENIAQGYTTPASVMAGWMNSPGHKQNILNPNFKEIGVGHAANGNYWVQMFATR